MRCIPVDSWLRRCKWAYVKDHLPEELALEYLYDHGLVSHGAWGRKRGRVRMVVVPSLGRWRTGVGR